jgi:hypothetical protein
MRQGIYLKRLKNNAQAPTHPAPEARPNRGYRASPENGNARRTPGFLPPDEPVI